MAQSYKAVILHNKERNVKVSLTERLTKSNLKVHIRVVTFKEIQ